MSTVKETVSGREFFQHVNVVSAKANAITYQLSFNEKTSLSDQQLPQNFVGLCSILKEQATILQFVANCVASLTEDNGYGLPTSEDEDSPDNVASISA
tara:strand:- start:290 stop:583 length:294 start_codon:yes stop_codon:yes gene_type:complete